MKQKTKALSRRCCWGLMRGNTVRRHYGAGLGDRPRGSLLIGMQYETTGLDLDAVPGWLAALVMLHQNFFRWTAGPGGLPPRGWPCCSAGCAVSVRAKPKRTELVLSIVFGIAEVLGLSICKLGSWAFVFKIRISSASACSAWPGTRCCSTTRSGAVRPAGHSRTGGENFPQTRFAAWFGHRHRAARRRAHRRGVAAWVAVFWPAPWTGTPGGRSRRCLRGCREMTAHHTVLSTWLHGWLFRLGRALGSVSISACFST